MVFDRCVERLAFTGLTGYMSDLMSLIEPPVCRFSTSLPCYCACV